MRKNKYLSGKTYYPEPTKPVEPSKTISKQVCSKVEEVGTYVSFPEILSRFDGYSFEDLSIEDDSDNYGDISVQIVGRKYEEVENDKYESGMKKYQKDLEKYKEDLKEYKKQKKEEAKVLKQNIEKSERETLEKLKKKYE